MSRDDHAVQVIEFERALVAKTKTKHLLQRSQRCHKGEFRHVSISARQRSLRCGQNLSGPFLRATLPARALKRWRTTGRQNGSNSTTKVSFCTIIIRLCHCMVAITTRPWPNLLFLLPILLFLLKFSTYFAFYCIHFAFNYTHFDSRDEVMLHKFAAPIPSAILVDLSSCCSHQK